MQKNRIIFFILISITLIFPQILFSNSYYNTYGHIDRNLRQETFDDDTGRHVTVKIFKDAGDIGTNRIISGLNNYDKRVELYRNVIMSLVTQPKTHSVDLIYEEAEQGVSKEELLAQAAVLYEAGSFSVNLVNYIAQYANLAYISGTDHTAQMVNSWKHMMRQVKHSNLHNVSNALGAISLVMNIIEIGDKVAVISSNYILLKALEMDLAHERLRLLQQYCYIDDDAFTEALTLVTNEMNTLPQSDWNKMLTTLRNQGTEVQELIITTGQSINTLGSLLTHVPKISPIHGWIFAGLFTWQTGVMIQGHKDHMRTSSLAATIYSNMKFPKQPEKIYEVSEYAQYLFADEFWLAFDNCPTLVLSWFSQSWYELRQHLQDESNYLLKHIHRRRVQEAIVLLEEEPIQPPTTSSCIDIDGNVYQTVQIGDQLWMAENLKVIHYRNGDKIPHLTDNDDWTSTSSGAYCYYNNDPANEDTYGALYNWYAVDDSRGLSPEGWHVPTDAELIELTKYLGSNAGSKLAGGYELWNNDDLRNNPEFDTSGFSFLPGGYRSNYDGYFVGYDGYFWSSTEHNSHLAWFRILYYNRTTVGRYDYHKQDGFSVRCVRSVE